MSGVHAVQSTSRYVGSEASPTAPAGDGGSLLPPPAPSALAGGDALAALYYLESKDGQDGVKTGAERIQGLNVERQHALADELKAIQQEDEAASHHDFWSDLGNACGEVAKAASVVASIAAAVGTAGAATPLAAVAIAGAALSTAGFVDGETHLLQKLGIDAHTAEMMDLGMSLAGAGASVGAGLMAGAKTASATADVVSRTAMVTAGVATVGKGAAEIESSQALAAEDRAAADEAGAEAHGDALGRAVQQVIAEVTDADQKSQQLTKTISQTMSLQMQTGTIAASAVGAMKG